MHEFTSIETEDKNESDDDKKKMVRANQQNINLMLNVNNLTFKNLSIHNLSFRFPGQCLLLKDVSLEIEKGKITALVGESGCGKTSLLYIIEKFYHAEQGEIYLNSFRFNAITTIGWRDIFGVVPQEITLFNGNLLENICLASSEKEFKKVMEFCSKFGFDKYFNAFPQSYATILGEEGIHLSGGQKQLLALARALYKKPQILLLDEPTSAMDRNTEQFVIDLI